MLACLLLAFSLSYSLDDGWRGWVGLVSQLVVCGGSVAVERWLLRDRGVRLPWFPPLSVNKKMAKIYWPLIVVLALAMPVGGFWLLGKSFWLIFSALGVGAMVLVAASEYRYKNYYESSKSQRLI